MTDLLTLAIGASMGAFLTVFFREVCWSRQKRRTFLKGYGQAVYEQTVFDRHYVTVYEAEVEEACKP